MQENASRSCEHGVSNMIVYACLTCAMRAAELRVPPKTVQAQKRLGDSAPDDDPRARRVKTSTTEPMAPPARQRSSTAMMPDNRFTQSRCRRPPTNENLSLVDDRHVERDLHRYQLLAILCSQTGGRPRSGRTRPAPARREKETLRFSALNAYKREAPPATGATLRTHIHVPRAGPGMVGSSANTPLEDTWSRTHTGG